ncbi:MAG: hypothetical protein ACE5FS_00475 [Paracoccaceae bacterium]
MSVRWKLYWLLVAATLAVYFTMLLWSLRRIASAAGGLAPFDLRPGGYGFEDARAFLGALDADTVAFYLNVQHRLDLVYPAMLAAVLGVAVFRLLPGPRALKLAAVAVPVVGAACDYLENAAVAELLRAGAGDLTREAVSVAGRWTVLKSSATSLSMLLLAGLLVYHALRYWRGRGTG